MLQNDINNIQAHKNHVLSSRCHIDINYNIHSSSLYQAWRLIPITRATLKFK